MNSLAVSPPTSGYGYIAPPFEGSGSFLCEQSHHSYATSFFIPPLVKFQGARFFFPGYPPVDGPLPPLSFGAQDIFLRKAGTSVRT